MRSRYPLRGPVQGLTVQVEAPVYDALFSMVRHTKFTSSEIVNTALKRFISQHKDFLPPDYLEAPMLKGKMAQD